MVPANSPQCHSELVLSLSKGAAKNLNRLIKMRFFGPLHGPQNDNVMQQKFSGRTWTVRPWGAFRGRGIIRVRPRGVETGRGKIGLRASMQNQTDR
jgi:hypothetical protein